MAEMDLGFVEEVESHKLASIFFPSKVGGKPAWLSQTGIPMLSDLECSVCGNLMKFLVQIYAPRDEQAECFHRTLYVFCCSNSDCFKKNDNTPFKVFRSQLPRKNQFFDDDPAPENMRVTDIQKAVNLLHDKWGNFCEICGHPSNMKCSACKTISYCSKTHQTYGWKESHKSECAILKKSPEERKFQTKSSWNFPEFELVTEPEPLHSKSTSKETVEAEADDAKQNQLTRLLTDEGDLHDNQNAIFNELKETEDKQFQKFKKTIAKEPDQVLRYSYNGQPLWVSREHIPKDSEIPNCSCGSKRVFEFQILPQLLNHLNVDSLHQSIDWGTLVVYTCAKNCHADQEYAPEFLWKQDFSEDTLK